MKWNQTIEMENVELEILISPFFIKRSIISFSKPDIKQSQLMA